MDWTTKSDVKYTTMSRFHNSTTIFSSRNKSCKLIFKNTYTHTLLFVNAPHLKPRIWQNVEKQNWHTTEYDDVPFNLTWLQKEESSSTFMAETVISDYKPSLQPWPQRQQTNLSILHSGPWWCITITSLVTKGSEVEKIWSKCQFN